MIKCSAGWVHLIGSMRENRPFTLSFNRQKESSKKQHQTAWLLSTNLVEAHRLSMAWQFLKAFYKNFSRKFDA